MKKLLLLSSICLLIVSCSYDHTSESSADFPFHQTPVVAGDISNQRVTAFAEDDQGHVWIGTFRGLNKSTGREFHQYFSTEDSLSIPDNHVTVLFNDTKSRLWVGTVNGIGLYTQRDDFHNIPVESSGKTINQILENLAGEVFLNTGQSICVFDEATQSFKEAIDYFRVPLMQSTCHIAPNNDLWLITSVDMRRYSSSTMELKDSIGLSSYPLYSYMTDDGKIWLAGHSGVSMFDTREGVMMDVPQSFTSHPHFKGAVVTAMHPYSSTSLILRTEKHGLFLYNFIEDILVHQSETTFPFEVPDFYINAMFTDSQNNIWIGSYDQGYTVRYSYKKRFNNDNFLSTLTQNTSVMSVDCDSKGNLWVVSMRDGLFRYDPDKSVRHSVDNRKLFGYATGDDVNITRVFVDDDDKVWLLFSQGVARCIWDGRQLRVEQNYFVHMPMSITQDAEGTIWIGTASEYLYYIEYGSVQAKAMKPLISNYTFMSDLLVMPDGNLLVSAFGSVLKEIDKETRTVFDANVDQDSWRKITSRSEYIPTCLFVDSSGVIWLGTLANGLLKYDRKTNSLTRINGTPCNDICSIEEDDHGNLWVSTQYGLGKYDRTTERFINWFEADGIGGNQFYDRASCRLPDGILVFGGTHGLTYFNPIDVTISTKVPFCFELLKVNNSIVHPSGDECIDVALPYKPEINLENSQNNFSISFAALDYSEFDRVNYQYMLEGHDHFWIDSSDNRREAHYTNVPAGRYIFKVRVTNNEQTVLLAEDQLKIKVGRPLWLSWWAMIFYLAIVVALAWGVLKIRERIVSESKAKLKAQQEKEQEKKVNEMNMSYFANISHEFRTPLTMISGPVDQLVGDSRISPENRRLLSMVQRNTRRMQRLVNQLLDFNKLDNGQLKLQVKQIDVIAQLRNLTDIYKVTADEKGVFFKTWGLEESLMIWADDDKLDKICFNLLSNAMKFTSVGGRVEFGIDVISRDEAANLFSLKADDTDTRWLKIVVKDSGPGIPAEHREKIFERYYQIGNQIRGSYNWGTGIGLFFAKSLSELHHGYLKAGDRDEGKGAQFTLILPVSASSYAEDEKNYQGGADITFTRSSVKFTEIPEQTFKDGQRVALVVDDDVDVTRYLKELLLPYFRVIAKHDADSAYIAMKEEAPDIVLSDVMMPGKDGYELCRQIKENIQLSHIPVILITAKVGVDSRVEGLGVGADAYVTKPFEPKFLLAQIDSLLKNREKLKTRLSESTDVESLEEDSLSPQDSAFMTELYQLMENELSNSELDVAQMTEMLHISRTKFYYKVKGLTGENPSVFFKRYKLNRAAQLMKDRRYNISEIADMTGFSTLSHFSTSFKKQFGVSPSEYMK